jgi:hypothetical protein
VAWGVDDSVVVFLGLELSQGNVDGDTSISLGFKLVQYPSECERALSDFVGFLLELFNGSFIDTTAKVDQVPSGGGLS